MLTEAPSPDVLKSHMGSSTMMAWNTICAFIDQNYDMEPSWNYGGKHGKYVLRFKKGGKTICTLYVRDNQLGCWMIFGQNERDKFERSRSDFTDEVRSIYDAGHYLSRWKVGHVGGLG